MSSNNKFLDFLRTLSASDFANLLLQNQDVRTAIPPDVFNKIEVHGISGTSYCIAHGERQYPPDPATRTAFVAVLGCAGVTSTHAVLLESHLRAREDDYNANPPVAATPVPSETTPAGFPRAPLRLLDRLSKDGPDIPHWDYYKKLFERARGNGTPSTIEAYTGGSDNFAYIQMLPYLAPIQLANDRFCFAKGEHRGCFNYYGRTVFKRMYDEILKMDVFGKRLMHVHGTVGAGKSHILAALVTLLVRQGKRVVYIADCLPFVKTPIGILQTALALAFADHPEILADIEGIKDRETAEAFCRSISKKHIVYFFVDQVNVLDPVPSGKDRVPEESKVFARKLLDQISSWHIKIQGSSGNYSQGWYDRFRQCGEFPFAVYGGLNTEEMARWWARAEGGLQWSRYLREEDRERVQEETGCVPYLLSAISAKQVDSDMVEVSTFATEDDAEQLILSSDHAFNRLLAYLEKSRVVSIWAQMLNTFAVEKYELSKESIIEARFLRALSACLAEAPAVPYSDTVLDHRFFYVENNLARTICGIIKRLASPFLRVHGILEFNSQRWYTSLASACNPSVLGFLAEEMLLSYIASHGAAFLGEDREKFEVVHFEEDIPPFKNVSTLYIPRKFNYAYVDAIYVAVNTKNTRSTTKPARITGIQITLQKSTNHSEAETPFITKVNDWLEESGMDWAPLSWKFVWLVEQDEGKGDTKVEESDECPEYERSTISFHTISPRIGKSVQDARLKVAKSGKRSISAGALKSKTKKAKK